MPSDGTKVVVTAVGAGEHPAEINNSSHNIDNVNRFIVHAPVKKLNSDN
jgi:hypothetical protein